MRVNLILFTNLYLLSTTVFPIVLNSWHFFFNLKDVSIDGTLQSITNKCYQTEPENLTSFNLPGELVNIYYFRYYRNSQNHAGNRMTFHRWRILRQITLQLVRRR